MQKIVVIIPSFNNAQWYSRNLSSVCGQNYENYRVIYVDDCSTDRTGDLVEDFIKKTDQEAKIKLIKNQNRLGALQNLYNAIHSCEDEEIIVTVDGDDWLAHSGVLKKIDSVYSDPNVWMTYGSYIDIPQNTRGCSKQISEQIINNNSFRKAPWSSSHLRTFKKWLFAKISKEDLLAPDGTFFRSAWDLSFMIPMLEMSGHHSKYIHDILYCYNNLNPINDYKVRLQEQQNFEKIIRNKKIYQRI